jgi:hypothetical protein
MFLENSRYFGQKTMTVKAKAQAKDGRIVTALEPRQLPDTPGDLTELNANDRLDILAQRIYQDSTRFWHIADANSLTEGRLLAAPLEANSATPPVTTLLVPKK